MNTKKKYAKARKMLDLLQETTTNTNKGTADSVYPAEDQNLDYVNLEWSSLSFTHRREISQNLDKICFPKSQTKPCWEYNNCLPVFFKVKDMFTPSNSTKITDDELIF